MSGAGAPPLPAWQASATASGLYNGHFGFESAPFSLTPDTQFFFEHASCRDALNTLLLAVRSGEGFTKVVGEVGTGKTLLCRLFLNSIEGDFATAYIPNPYLEPRTLLLAIADELGMDYANDINQHQLLKQLTAFLVDSFAATGTPVVVCLDEAHALPTESLEALRLLSNLETEKRKLIQLVLFGQPELDSRLSHPGIRQLQQRIAFSSRLQPLTGAETNAYVAHRLRVAGYSGVALFRTSAMWWLHRTSGGIPRLINILAHKSLALAFGEGSTRIGARHVHLAALDTQAALSTHRRHGRRLFRYAAGAAAWLLTLGLAFLLGGAL